MQIISRRVHEGVVIGEETQITVMKIDRQQNCVTLGIRCSSGKNRYQEVTLYLRSDDDGGEGDVSCVAEQIDNLDDSRELTVVFS